MTDIPADYFAPETVLYPICQCGELIKDDEPFEHEGELVCDGCMSDIQLILNQAK